MQKLKDRGNNAVPPKKSASAYIIFGIDVSLHIFMTASFISKIEKSRNFIEKSTGKSYRSGERDSLNVAEVIERGETEIQRTSQKR